MLRPEISPQIHNLPCTKANQHSHRSQSKPFDSLIRALIRISELLLSMSQVLHLSDNLIDVLLDSSQLSVDRAELLCGLNGRPISGIGANIDIEFDVA